MSRGESPSMLPCPFCGGVEIFVAPDEIGSGGQDVPPYHVGCVACKCEQCKENEDDAIAAWNRRAPSEYVRQMEIAYQSAVRQRKELRDALRAARAA